MQDLNIEQSLCSKSKPMPLQTCLRKWKRDKWFQRLCGRILKPCQWTAFETELTYSLAVIHAKDSAHQDSERAHKTRDICGDTLGDISNQLDLFGASLKTSKDIYLWDLERSLKIWRALVTRRSGEYLARVNAVRPTSASASLSWPTPRASEYKGVGPLNSKSHNHMLEKKYLNATVQHVEQTTGSLNPTWVEWLMGLPSGWTDLDSWATE